MSDFLAKIYQKLPFEIPVVHAIYWNYWRKYGKYHQRSGLYFEVHLVDHCNLNCCKCNHYSPLSKPWFIDIADFEKDMQRMAQIAGNEPPRRKRANKYEETRTEWKTKKIQNG